MSNDTISNCLTTIRNACLIKKPTVCLPFTKVNQELVKVLDQEGLILGFRAYSNYLILIRLRYEGIEKVSHIRGIQRVSRPGCRIYTNVTKIPKVLGGMGITVLSTSKGIMADRDARKLCLGGEILCRIW
jgi:small subunit ribosomal protein S8